MRKSLIIKQLTLASILLILATSCGSRNPAAAELDCTSEHSTKSSCDADSKCAWAVGFPWTHWGEGCFSADGPTA